MDIGIDYSLTSPAVCVRNGGTFHIHYLASAKKHVGVFTKGNFTFEGHVYPTYHKDQERYFYLASWTVAKFPYENNRIAIEGYSMGSKGKVFHIAENTGILKHLLWSNNMDFITPSPTEIKKFATGKGNSKKEVMLDNFIKDTGIDPREVIGTSAKSPISDIVDAYYICKYLSK